MVDFLDDSFIGTDDENEDSLFGNTPITEEDKNPAEGKKNTETTEVDADELFDGPEKVSSEKDTTTQEQKDASTDKADDTSPSTVFSSIAAALKEEGVLTTLGDDDIKNVKSPEDFKSLIEKEVSSKFDERQQRIDEALQNNISKESIQYYEGTLAYLNTLNDNSIMDETDAGETLRKQLIMQDLINKGFDKTKAEKFVDRSVKSGTDIEDAKEALISNKEYFRASYKKEIDESKQAILNENKLQQEQAVELQKVILETEEPFVGVKVDAATRKKVYDNISKPVFTDSDGTAYTAIQKYEKDNKTEFIHKLGLIFTLTDGFKNLDKIVQSKVNNSTRKALSELESKLSNSPRNADGTIRLMSGVGIDNESKYTNLVLDV